MRDTMRWIPCMAVLGALLATTASAAKEPRFRAIEIDGEIGVGYAVEVGEMNGDGKPDIIVVDKREVVWYENPYWTKHVIVKDVGPRDNVCIAVDDIDGDGLSEIAIGAHWNPGDTVNSGSVYYLIPPKDRRGLWKPVELHHEPTVHRMRWADVDADGKFELIVKPLHGRGNNRNFEGAGLRVLAYEMPADPARDDWTTSLVDDALHVSHSMEVVQWDDDPAQELLLASYEGVFLCDRAADGTWTRTQLGTGDQESRPHRGASEIRTGRLPGGTRYLATTEPWHGHQAVVYMPPSRDGALWKRKVLCDDLQHGHAVKCGDFLGEGYDQLVVGWRLPATEKKTVGVRLYVPRDARGERWDMYSVDEGGMACEDLAVGDLNGDGRLDILASGRATHNVKIYFNLGPK